MLRAYGSETSDVARPGRRAFVAPERLSLWRGLDGTLDGALGRPEASRWWGEVLQHHEGAWYSRLDRGTTREQYNFIGAFARVPAAVASLARAGERNAVNHCLRHPEAYARAWSFRQQTLDAAHLDALLRHADAPKTTAAYEHVWGAEGLRALCSWPGPTLTFDLHEARWLPHTPGNQAYVDEARARAYLGTGQPVAELRHLGCSYPALVLTSLLRRGEAEAAEALLDAGCLLPRLVVERWCVREHVGACDCDCDCDGEGEGADEAEFFWGTTSWHSRRTPLSACLRGAGWRPTSVQRRVAHALLARGARPTWCERFKLAVAYRQPRQDAWEETIRLLGTLAVPRPS